MKILVPTAAATHAAVEEHRSRCALGGLALGGRFIQHAHDVAFLHDEEIDAIDLDFGARPLAEQDALADLDVERNELASLVAATGADGDNFALRGLLFGSVRNDDAARGLLFGIKALDDDAVVKRAKFHGSLLRC